LIGDRVYGKKGAGRGKGKGRRRRGGEGQGDQDKGQGTTAGSMEIDAGRQMLHAWYLSFRHPWSGRRVSFSAPVPEDMSRFMKKNPEEPCCSSSGL